MLRLVNYVPKRGAAIVIGALPIAAVIAGYFIASADRLAVNPKDKLMPGAAQIWDAIVMMAARVDLATNSVLLWSDTLISLERVVSGIVISAALGLVVGTVVGFIPYLRALFSPFFAALSLIPPLAVLPILFIIFGLGETSKIVLIVFGVAPFLVRDVAMTVAALPREQIVKAQTLGGSTWQMLIHLVVPQVMPRLVDSLRLSLGGAWLFLISAEAIASDSGLGYRLFLVRRYMAMDIIMTYVVWITFLAFLSDYGLKRLGQALAPWNAGRGA